MKKTKKNMDIAGSIIPKGGNFVGQFNLGFQAGVISANLNTLKTQAEVLPESKNKITFMTHISGAYSALETWARELGGPVVPTGLEA